MSLFRCFARIFYDPSQQRIFGLLHHVEPLLLLRMASAKIPLEVAEQIFQFIPELHDVHGFRIPQKELAEDAKIPLGMRMRKLVSAKEAEAYRLKQFGAIRVVHPNQLRLLNRAALTYVRRARCSKLLCRIKFKCCNFDFSKVKLSLAFLCSREAENILDNSTQGFKAKGLPDLATSYYVEAVEQIELWLEFTESLSSLKLFRRWFERMWCYVLQHFPAASMLSTDIIVCLNEKVSPNFLRADAASEALPQMPNNFRALIFGTFSHKHEVSDRVDRLFCDCISLVMHLGQATIGRIAGPLPYILNLDKGPPASTAGAFSAVKVIQTSFNETFEFTREGDPNFENPIRSLVGKYPELEELLMYGIRVPNSRILEMDLTPLRQAEKFAAFELDGDRISWDDCIEIYANGVLSKWDIKHPNLRTFRLSVTQGPANDYLPTAVIQAFGKLLDLSAGSYESLVFDDIFSIKQLLTLFNAPVIMPKVATIQRLSLHITTPKKLEAEEWSIAFRLFALINRAMPTLSALNFGLQHFDSIRAQDGLGRLNFTREPDASLLPRLIAALPGKVKHLTLTDVLCGPSSEEDEQWKAWLGFALQSLGDSKLDSLTLKLEDSSWVYSFVGLVHADVMDEILQCPCLQFANCLTAKGKRLSSVKKYWRSTEDGFPNRRGDPLYEICFILLNTHRICEKQVLNIQVREERPFIHSLAQSS